MRRWTKPPQVMARLNSGDRLRMMGERPSSPARPTTTVKLTERLERQGLRFLMLNLDDYFWSLVEHPTTGSTTAITRRRRRWTLSC